MYSIGQVVYTILEKEMKVYPLQIIEQIIKKTIEGESIAYKVKVPSKKENNVRNLSDFKNIHTDLEIVKEYLINNAKTNIEKMLNITSVAQERYFNTSIPNINLSEEEIDSKRIEVDLGSGMVGRIKEKDLIDAMTENVESVKKNI
jgi:hypothetical protein